MKLMVASASKHVQSEISLSVACCLAALHKRTKGLVFVTVTYLHRLTDFKYNQRGRALSHSCYNNQLWHGFATEKTK